ncbi:MAG: hypothetical protein NVS2B12_18950 [Ktedonobacteraceae bacterium]
MSDRGAERRAKDSGNRQTAGDEREGLPTLFRGRERRARRVREGCIDCRAAAREDTGDEQQPKRGCERRTEIDDCKRSQGRE